jgi:hypothetical protein
MFTRKIQKEPKDFILINYMDMMEFTGKVAFMEHKK